MYAQIVVDNPSPLLDRPFHYKIPQQMIDKIKTGSRAVVPFGLSDKPVEGYVVGICEECPDHIDKIKAIIRPIDWAPVFTEELITLAAWMREEYLCTWLEALQCITPASTRHVMDAKKPGKYRLWVRPAATETKKALPKNAARMKAVMSFLEDKTLDEVCCSTLMEQTGCSLQTLRSMEKKGLLSIFDKRVLRAPQLQTGLISDRVEQLSISQKNAISEIQGMYRQGVREVLLHGITGSGKTEVYMRLIGDTIREGRKIIVLVPEISLTPQMVEWYNKRFGNRAALFHSRLSAGERYDQWEGIKQGYYDVAIGARSAVFAPFENLGLIIIDEEHEHTYKSESSPRYITHRVAARRCSYYGGLLVMGSATPSVETYYRARRGDIGLVQLKERVGGSILPSVEVVDMREELREGNRSVFSKRLTRETTCALSKSQQVILLLNRRGYSTFVSCRSCGNVVKCKKCDISMTYHRGENSLVCHFCGYRRKLPKNCEICGSDRIKYMGSGTEKLEKAVETNFKEARVLRMDMDTTRKKGSHYSILKAFNNRKADILLGTQMIAKGLDFPGVTLVGVIMADFNLNLPDFRAAEKTFQLLTQVSGRAGRGSVPGNVVIQTYFPEHYSIVAAKSHDYEGFYAQEIEIREKFGYPPFLRLINIVISGVNLKQVVEGANIINRRLRERLQGLEELKFEILGPSQAIHSKIKEKYRWQIIIKTAEMERVVEELRAIRLEFIRSSQKGPGITIDIDPINLS